MDSGNSGSFQSSSGGGGGGGGGVDEEYESSSNLISLHHPQAPFFNSFSGYLDAFPSPPPLPGPSCTGIGGLVGCSSAATNVSTMISASSSQSDQLAASAPRGSRKRSRASRRAPTTVLNTDTSNFRQMVQEFTGIPESPFSMLSSFPRSRFDPFHAAASGIGSSSQESSPAFLLRPFSQKILATTSLGPFASTGTTINTTTSSATVLPNSTSLMSNSHGVNSRMVLSTATATTIAPLGYAANSSSYGDLHGSSNHHLNFLPMQNPTVNFQPMLQSSAPPAAQKYSFPAMAGGMDYTTSLMTSDALRKCVGDGGASSGGGDLSGLINGSGGNREDFSSINSVNHKLDIATLPENGSSQGNLDSSWIFSSN